MPSSLLPPHKNQDLSKRASPRPIEDTSGEPAIGIGAHQHTDPVAFWAKEGRWPKEQDWPEETSTTDFAVDRCLLARKKSSFSLSRKRSNSGTSMTPSDHKPREENSAPYQDARYPLLLQSKGSYMEISQLGITDTSKKLIRDLLSGKQPVPNETLFDDDIFVDVCRNLHNKNEARIIQDIQGLSFLRRNRSHFGKRTINALSRALTKGGTIRSPHRHPSTA